MASSSSSSSSSSLSFMKTLFVLLIIISQVPFSMGAVYRVGDSDGWTIGSVDYNNWASSKSFHPGDTLVFEYDAEFHNVMQVMGSDYESCDDATVPIAVFNSGKDTVSLKRSGDFFFICGAPGHCEAGQKVEIKVVPSSSSMNSAPSAFSPVPPPTSSTTASSIVSSETLLIKLFMALGVVFLGLAY